MGNNKRAWKQITPRKLLGREWTDSNHIGQNERLRERGFDGHPYCQQISLPHFILYAYNPPSCSICLQTSQRRGSVVRKEQSCVPCVQCNGELTLQLC